MIPRLIVLALASACGAPPQDRVVEYYILEDGLSGDIRANNTESSDDSLAPPSTAGQDPAASDDQPTMSFVHPSTPIQGGGVIDVVIELKNAPASTTWSLFYDTVATSTGGTPIIADVVASTTSTPWDTAGLPPATYYLFADVTHDGQTSRVMALGTVKVAPKASANAAPRLMLTSPNGENVLVAGTPHKITYAAQDQDGDPLTYKIEYSADGGKAWTLVADNVTTPAYDWNVTGLVQGIDYRVRVTARDGKDGLATAVSAKSFGVATQPVTFATGFGAMLTARCANCHAQGRANAGVFRSDNFAAGTVGVSAKAGNIKGRIEAGTMPPAGPLGAADKMLLTLWVWGGSK